MKKLIKYFSVLFLGILLTGCGIKDENPKAWIEENFEKSSSMELEYANKFQLDYLNDGYSFLSINDENYYLIVPEGGELPQKYPSSIEIISLPVNNIFVVGSGSMDFFVEADALELVKFASLDKKDWELEEVKEAIDSKSISFAGKYSAPDYELLLSNGCDLIVENTMITHTPEVLSQLKALGFPCMIDYASYEDDVRGRMEWIKLYGYLTNHEQEAASAFDSQLSLLEEVSKNANNLEKKTVGFFSITAAGTVSIRKTEDYICNMIEFAGGEYGFDSLDGIEGTGSTVIQMESFYEIAKNCDILIYNGTIEGEVTSIEDLISKNELLANCKAVENKTVYCTSTGFYQSPMKLGNITFDLFNILNGKDELSYLVKLQ